MPTSEELQTRIVELEMLVTHLQQDIQTLNGVILDHQKQLDKLRDILGRLDDRVSRIGDVTEKFDPGLERPPHY